MNSEFNQIKDGYQRNMFASGNNIINILELYQALPDVNITNEAQENLISLAARFTDVEGLEFLQNAGLN